MPKNRAFDHSKYQNWIDPHEVTEYQNNAKKHDDRQVKNIANSIRRFGWQQDTVLTSDNVLVIGHGRRLAALEIGCEMPYHRIDKAADELTDKDIRELRITDNQTNAETGFDWAKLELEIGDLDFSGFEFDFGDDVKTGGGATEFSIVEDEPPEPPKTAIAKLGDIWQLGEHRLMCGDSTDAEAWARLMDGEKADMVFTDPPYGVDYASKNEYLNAISRGNCIQVPIENDALANAQAEKDSLWVPAFRAMGEFCKDECAYYITSPQGGELMMMMMAIQEAGWQLKHTLIWNKNNHVLGRSDYNYKHEPILYGWKKRHKFYGGGEYKTSVWDIPKPQKSDLHPTMKPVALVANAIMDGSKEGMIVLDAFCGSGTTIIAAQQTNRKARCMELDPHYVDVIIARWENLTGEKAVLLNA